MISVAVNSPKTPVTEGSLDTAKATLPNVCKMPGPPAPFVPTPLPNIGRSADRLTDATATVTIQGDKVAIKGSYYMSRPSPDVASKGTGGGIISAATEGKTEFVAPGSMNVKAEGKNIQLLGDAMTNNGGSPPQTSCLPGNDQTSVKVELVCGDCGSYTKLKEKRAKPKFERDHIPSKAALRDAAINRAKPKDLDEDEVDCVAKKVEARGITIAIPKASHRNFSPTCGSRNTKTQLAADAKDPESMTAAIKRDLDEMQAHLDSQPDKACAAAYKEAAEKVRAHPNEEMMKKAIDECTS